MKLVSVEPIGNRGERLVTIEHRFLWWRWLTQYRGSGTIWRNVKTGKHGTLMDGEIVALLAQHDWRQEGAA